MLNFKDYCRFLHGSSKKTEKNYYLTKGSNGLPLWVIEPPDHVPEVVLDDPPEMTTPEVVSDYISDNHSRRR